VVRERGGTPFRQIFWSRNGAPANIVGHRWNANTEAFRQIAPKRGIWHQKSQKKISEGDTPRIPSAGGGDSLPHPPQHGKPFPQIKIYHCYHYYYYYYCCVCPSVCLSVPPGLGAQCLGQLGAQRLDQVSRDVQTTDPSTHA